jgi:ATP-binding cassette subfamily C protein
LYFIIKYFGIAKFVVLFLLVVIGTFLEIFSIAAIIPVLQSLQDPELLKQYWHFFENVNHSQQIVFVLSLLCLVFIIKFFFSIFFNHYQFKVSMNLQSQLSEKLIQNYMKMPYEKYFKIGSAEITKNVIQEPSYFVAGVLLPFIYLFSESLIVFGIGTLLVSKIGIESLSIILLFIASSYFYISLTKKTIQNLGYKRASTNQKIIGNSREALFGIRDIKINKTENIFFSFFNLLFDKNAKILTKFLTYQVAPRLGIELLVVIFLSLSMAILSLRGNNFSSIVSTLALLGLSAARLVPSASKVLVSLQNIRFYEISMLSIIKGLKIKMENNEIFNKNTTFKKKIELKKINYYYEKNKLILKNINFLINKGDKVGITGQTGSGKSTLVDILSGLLEPRSGIFLVDNKLIKHNKLVWGKNLGYVSQKTFLYNSTIRFNISFENNKKNDKKIYEILKLVELNSLVKNLKKKIDTNLGDDAIKISGGQKQRLGIARALYNNPDLLIFDESFSALDSKTEEKIIKNIFFKFQNMTIINIAHKGISLKYCNKVINLEKPTSKYQKNVKIIKLFN